METIIKCTGGPDCPVPHGVWLAASFRLGAAQPAAEPYPHVCQGPYPVEYPGRDCPACVAAKSARMLP